MRHLDLFSGIGGFALAAQTVWPDHQVVAFCDNEPFCQAVLEKHWPDAPIYGDIRQLTKDRYIRDYGDPGQIDLLTGGFPCQPFSVAGKKLAQLDDRHLWPQMFRVISEFRPTWVIGENVAGIVKLALDDVLADLASAGYSARTLIIPACAVGASHRRDRVWIIAHTTGEGLPGLQQSHSQRLPSIGDPRQPICCNNFENYMGPSSIPEGVRMDDGLPNRLDRVKALGNAIVPQVAIEIMRAIAVSAGGAPTAVSQTPDSRVRHP